MGLPYPIARIVSPQSVASVSQSTAAQQTDLQQRLAEVAGRAKNFTNAGGVAIALASGEQFTTFVTIGTSLEVGAVVPIPGSFGGFRKEKGNVLRCPDTDKEATIDIKACRAARIKSMLVVPVGDLSSIRGVLAVFSIAAGSFTETHVAVLKTLAEVISHLLPEKDKGGRLSETKVEEHGGWVPEKKVEEKKVDALLEHPFNPVFDPLPKAVKIGGDHADFSQISSSPPEPPSANKSSTMGSIFAGGATAPANIAKPAPGNGSSSASPAKASTPAPSRTTTSFQAPSAQGSVLDLASDPIAEGALVAPKRTSKRTTPRSSVATTTSFSPVSVRRQRSFDLKKFYTALIAVVVVVALGWGVYGFLADRNQKRIEQSYIIPPPATPRVNTSPSPAPTRLAEPVPARPAEPEPVQPAPAKVAPIQAAPVTSAPIKTDVVGSATAGALPERVRPPEKAPAPAPKPQRIVVEQKSGDSEVLSGQDILVVSRPSAADLRKLEEEAPPEVNVPSNSGMIGNVLNSSAPAPTPVLKQSQVVAAVLISKVAPIYPDQAKRYGLSGKVTINAKVTKTGAVGEVHPLSGNSILSEAAISAVKKWRYKPATMDGRPVDSNVELTFDFSQPR